MRETLSGIKAQEQEVIARQLSQLAHEAHRNIFNELTQSGIDFYETHDGRDIRLQIIKEYQLWRDRCISSAESLVESFLKYCKELNIDPVIAIGLIRETLDKLIEDTSRSLELSLKTFSVFEPESYPKYVNEAEELRPYLTKRITEIIENAKDGYCRGALIFRYEQSPGWIGRFWHNQWQTILLGFLTAAGGAIATLLWPTIKTSVSSWLGQ